MECDVLVIGGGAAGFFGAIRAAEEHPGQRILILEKSGEFLKKVRLSGGGRCNITHGSTDLKDLCAHYPRNGDRLFQIFKIFDGQSMRQWLRGHGLETVEEEDGRVFPKSNKSETVVNLFLALASKFNIALRANFGVSAIEPLNGGFAVMSEEGVRIRCRRILAAPGGAGNLGHYQVYRSLGHGIQKPLPALFTLRHGQPLFLSLAGVSLPDARVEIPELGLHTRGPVLLTHWGLSGPAILRLSSLGAIGLAEKSYRCTAVVEWNPDIRPAIEAMAVPKFHRDQGRHSLAAIFSPLGLPKRLLESLIRLAGKDSSTRLSEVSRRDFAELRGVVRRWPFAITGKGPNNEEFVTAGGIPCSEINLATMESKLVPGLFFAGEVVDIDGLTGGFNFQAAWTTAFIAGKNLKKVIFKNNES